MYRRIRNETKNVIKSSIKIFERKLVEESRTNKKGLWKFINKKLTRRTGIGILRKSAGGFTRNYKEKAEILNEYFSEVFVRENLSNIPNLLDKHNDNQLPDIQISKDTI